MSWLFGRSSQSSSPPPEHIPPPQTSDTRREPAVEAPDIDAILAASDPAKLHPLANLDKQTLDYIILEEAQIKSRGALPSRGWTDDLCYGTGATYLTALAAGGTWGLIEALRKPSAAVGSHSMLNPSSSLNATARAAAGAAADSPNFASATAANTSYTATRQSGRLFLNNVLNHVTRRGPFLGNSAGVLAMTYNIIDAILEAWTPIPHLVTPYVSGFLAGAMFRSTKGPRAMVIAGTLVTGVVGAWQGIKRSLV